jgi:GNAT superfamily N-acetyltransferase
MWIRRATTDDLALTKKWLQTSGSGFYGNWSMIEAAQARNEMFVSIADGCVVAFCVSSATDLSILEVHKDIRKHGIGRRLVSHVIANARETDSWGLIGFCRPTISLEFWRKVGFEHAWDPQEEFRVVFPFRHAHSLLPTDQRCELRFELHNHLTDALIVARTIKGIATNGVYSLSEDFLEYVACGDTRMIISSDGNQLFDGKCKNAESVGGERRSPWVRFQQLSCCTPRSM